MARKTQEKTTLKTATLYAVVRRDDGSECGCNLCKAPEHGGVDVDLKAADGTLLHTIESSCDEANDVLAALNLRNAPEGSYRLTITGETGSPARRRRR